MSAEAEADPLGLIAFAKVIRDLDLKQRVLQHEIDGIMYTSTKLPAEPAGRLLPIVTRMVLPMLRASGAGDALGVLENLASSAVDDDWIGVSKRLLDRTDCGKLQGRDKSGRVLSEFDEHFAGEFPHLARVTIFVALHNFWGFTRGVH